MSENKPGSATQTVTGQNALAAQLFLKFEFETFNGL